MVKKLGLKLKEQKGFTLIELLAVIVILGIIAAIAIPAISSVISKSDAKAQAQEGVQIINAAKLIVANKEANFNTAGTEATILKTGAAAGEVDLMDYLDRVDATTTFSVKVTKSSVASGGKYTYTLYAHPSVLKEDGTMDTAGKDEQALIEAAK
jgi:type IV pilus assembly protein PilA